MRISEGTLIAVSQVSAMSNAVTSTLLEQIVVKRPPAIDSFGLYSFISEIRLEAIDTPRRQQGLGCDNRSDAGETCSTDHLAMINHQ
ncbi:hypothetical protein ACVWY3_000635 [Bradyrhizobium sp. USDA 4486]